MEMENLMLEKYQKQENFTVFSRPLVLQSRGVELLWKWRFKFWKSTKNKGALQCLCPLFLQNRGVELLWKSSV